MGRYIIGITGASGSIYADSLLRALLAQGHEVLVTASRAGKLVLHHELGLCIEGLEEAAAQAELRRYFGAGEALYYYAPENIAAPIASGSAKADAMVVLPCSMGTLGSIRAGVSGNLLQRAADVMLKERRPLFLVPRESPCNTIHLENMAALSGYGAVIVPASPGFYAKPKTLEELIAHFTGRLLDQLGLPQTMAAPWQGLEER